jgi:ankyrin repeat protein
MKKVLFFLLIILTTATAFANKEKWDDNKTEWSPLMLAIYNGESGKMMLMIMQGADINYMTPGKATAWKLTAMDVAIRKQDETAVEKLLSTNRIAKPGKYLITASELKSAAIVEKLITHGASPNDTLENGYSPLIAAASLGSAEVLEILLRKMANPLQTRKPDGMTALMMAAYNADVEKVRMLLNYKSEKYAKDANGHDAYYYVEHLHEHMDVNERSMEHLKTMLQ